VLIRSHRLQAGFPAPGCRCSEDMEADSAALACGATASPDLSMTGLPDMERSGPVRFAGCDGREAQKRKAPSRAESVWIRAFGPARGFPSTVPDVSLGLV